jgi:hypothetical protein
MHAGVDDVEIDMGMQKVTVTGWAEQKKVLRAVRKTGRRAEVWQLPHNPELHFDANQYHCNGAVTFSGPQPTSSYNYYKHGYDIGHPHPNNYYQRPSHSTIFSDDNPNACSIM